MFYFIRKLGALQQFAKSDAFFEAFSGANTITTGDGARTSKYFTTRKNTFPLELTKKLKMQKNIRTLQKTNHSIPLTAGFSKEETREFMTVFPILVRDLMEYASTYDSKLGPKWLNKVLQYNVPKGKKIRGLTVVLTFKHLCDKSQLTAENIRLAQYLGWCLEMLQSSFLISDDIMDKSITRRGTPCWHTLEDVGMIAINDSVMIGSGIFYILKKYFSHKNYYMNLLDLFHEGAFITSVGQTLEAKISGKNVVSFTMDQYKNIVCNKTAFYAFYLPVALGMQMVGFTDSETFRQARTILFEIGTFFQIQNDFLDCFGDPGITGKIGTDIRDNRCSWLALVCMQIATDEQKEIMRECYGQNDSIQVARVMQLYKELDLPNTYAIYEEESYNAIRTHIQEISCGLSHEIFFQILDRIYKRNY